jgi:hypothetical protein
VVTIAPISTGHSEDADLEGYDLIIKDIGAFMDRYSPDIGVNNGTIDGEGTNIERDSAKIVRAA